MEQYIPKSVLVAGIEKIIPSEPYPRTSETLYGAEKYGKREMCFKILDLIDTLEVKELAPMSYVVTRCEEQSDYVEKVFFNEDKAQAYCEQFKENENEYARHITKIKVTL